MTSRASLTANSVARMKETVIQRKGYALDEPKVVRGYRIAREPRDFVRRTVTLELSLDRRVRDIIVGKCSYSDAMEQALELFVAAHSADMPDAGQTAAMGG